MPMLGSCCFCLDLKVGTTIIGTICLISAIMQTLSWGISSVAIGMLSGATDAGHSVLTQPGNDKFDFGGGDDDDYADAGEVAQQNQDDMAEFIGMIKDHLDTIKVLCYCLVVYSLLLVIAASMLIHGVRRNRRGLLIPWVILECVKTLLFVVLPITLLSILSGNEIIIYTSLSFFIAVGLEVYFVLVVISQYQALGIIRMHNDEINMK